MAMPQTDSSLVRLAWEQALGRDPVLADDNFFHLGGNSLTALRVVKRLKDRYPAVSLSVLFSNPMLADFCAAIGPAADEQPAGGASVEPDGQPPSRAGQLNANQIERLTHFLLARILGREVQPDATYTVHRIRGPLQINRLEAVIKALAEDLPIFRYEFVVEAGSWQRRLRQSADAAQVCATARIGADSLTDRVQEVLRGVTPLARAPLVKFRIFVTGPDETFVVLAAPHVLLDLWSAALITEQISAMYNTGKYVATELADAADDDLSAGEQARRVAFWRATLGPNPLPVPLLNSDICGYDDADCSPVSVHQELPVDVAFDVLDSPAVKSRGASLAMLLLLSLREIMPAFLRNADELPIVYVDANRGQAMDAAVANTVDFLPLRFGGTEPGGTEPGDPWPGIREVQDLLSDVYDNHLPYAEIVRHICPERYAEVPARGGVYLNVRPAAVIGEPALRLPGLDVSEVWVDSPVVARDLVFSADVSAGILRLTVTVPRGLVTLAGATDVLAHWLTALTRLLSALSGQ